MAEINDLSTIDGSNTARFPENQLPSTVNDGARALEGLIARWHKDINGSVTASGSSNAYVVAANQTLSAYYNGLDITFQANHTNNGASTLNVDSIGAVAIEKDGSTALAGGEIVSGNKYRVIHDGTNFILTNPSPLTATDAAQGMVELATNAEANTGTATNRALTPANLGQAISGQTAETAPATGDSVLIYDASATANRSMTMVNLLKVVNSLTEDTSPDKAADFVLTYDTSASAVKKALPNNLFTVPAATQAELEAGSSTTVVTTPGRQQYHDSAAKAWAVFTSGSTPSVSDSYNVSSVTRPSTGQYTINFTTAFSSANYAVIPNFFDASPRAYVCHVIARTTTACTVGIFTAVSPTYTDTFTDMSIAVFGDQ